MLFGVKVGLSDHTMGLGVSVAAVALGASVIEKHFTLARSDGGPDSSFSLEKEELKSLVENSQMAFQSIGRPNYSSTPEELKTKCHRRSLYIVKDIEKGEKLTTHNVRSIRPGGGLKPKYYDEILGKVANVNIGRGTPLRWENIK